MNLFHTVNTEFGITTVIVTHDRQLSHMVPRVVTISDGRIGTEFIRREEIDMESNEIMDATAGHDQGSHVEYGFIDGRKRLFFTGKLSCGSRAEREKQGSDFDRRGSADPEQARGRGGSETW